MLFPWLASAQDKVKFNMADSEAYLKGYLYPEFQNGKLFSKDGSYGVAKMNFNGFSKELLFIAPTGDTLRLLHPETTLMVTIVTDTFCFYENTFLRKITHYAAEPNLFGSLELKFITAERPTGYGYSVITASSSIGSIENTGGTLANVSSEDKNLIFGRSKDVFVRNDKGDFLPVKQASFINMFPQHKAEVKIFIETKNIRFKNQKDVIQLIDYMHSLKMPE